MNSITEFKREFSRAAQGYAPQEVDAAVRMLVGYGAELESANAEFAEVNDELMAELDRLTAEKESADRAAAGMQSEIETLRARLAEAGETIRQLQAAQAERQIAESARCADEEKRYASLCRRTRILTDALRALYAEQMPAIEALAEAAADGIDDQPIAAAPADDGDEDVKIASPVTSAVEPDAAATTTFTIPSRPRIRRAAMAAAAVEADAVEPEPEPVEPPVRSAARRPVRAAAVPAAHQMAAAAEPDPLPDAAFFLPDAEAPAASAEPDLSAIFNDAPTMQFPAVTDGPMADGVGVKSVYRPVSPAGMKAKGKTLDVPAANSQSFAAVRMTLEKIGQSLDEGN